MERFTPLTCLDVITFVSVFTVIETIYSKICVKPLPMFAKRPLSVAVRRSETPLLKRPQSFWGAQN